LRLLACETIPVEWRRVYAICLYLCLRAAELGALTWADVDFSKGTFRIDKTIDQRTNAAKRTSAVRDVPIPPTLLPLLRAMHAVRVSNDALVVPALRGGIHVRRARQFREHLTAAGVTRVSLFANTPNAIPLGFRSCRSSGIAWLALEGLPLHDIAHRCGLHVNTTRHLVATTNAYGRLFPPIPSTLLPSH